MFASPTSGAGPRPGTLSRLALLIALVAAVAALALPDHSSAAQAPKGFFGVHPLALEAGDYPLMADADVGLIRTGFIFGAVRPTEDPIENTDWGQYDAVVAGAAAANIPVLPVMLGIPGWLSNKSGATPLDSPEATTAWTDYLTAAIARYGPEGSFWAENPLLPKHPIEDWQIWNEPNSFNNWAKPDATEYGKLLTLSAKTIHAADPNARVISAGVISQPVNRKAEDGDVFLKKMLRSKQAAKAADAIAIHPYTSTVAQVRKQIELTRKVMDRAKLKKTPIWVTEVGWGEGKGSSNPLIVPAAKQRRNLRNAFRMTLEERRPLGIAKVVWYQWRDGTDTVCGWCSTSGLLEEDGTAKPLLDEFGAIARR